MENIKIGFKKLSLLFLLVLFYSLANADDPTKREQELLNYLQSPRLSEKEMITTWYNLAQVYIGFKPAEARIYIQKLLDYDQVQAKQYGRISLAGITLTEGQYDSTEVLLTEAREQFLSYFPTDTKMGSAIYNQSGHLETVRNFPETAIKYYLEALKYSDQTNDYAQMCAICTNISYLYGKVGAEKTVKLNYAYKALEFAEKSKDPWALEQAYSTLGNTLQEADSTEEALIYQLKGLELSRQMKSEQKECFAALNIGSNYLQLEKWNEAENYFMQALDLALKNNMKRPETYILSCLADVYRGMKKYEQSERYVQEALEKRDALSESEQLDIYLAAINLSVIRGDYSTFEKQFDAYLEQLDKVHNLAIHEKMVELETQYETEKKEKQIAELSHNQRMILLIGIIGLLTLTAVVMALFFRIRLIKSRKKLTEQRVVQLEQEQQLIATKAVLDGETTERSRLARDLHDGLGGMLSAVKFNLHDMKQGRTLESADVARFDKAMDMLDASINELRRVAHNMMPESLSRYGLKTALADFCTSMSNIHFHYFGNEARLYRSLEIMLYRTVLELVNNAVKHAAAENIHVQIVQESDRISLNVQDDGKGFDSQAENSGTGLKNIRNRVESFNGSFEIYSKPGAGTEITAEFRLQYEQL